MKAALLLFLRIYRRFLSPLKPPWYRCRFYPTCSSYAIEAVSIHGALRGGFLVLKRVLRCNPFCPGGVDYVPPKRNNGHIICAEDCK
ncbi:MAG: membrane protein insertion efficiency factor YidD [Oscillospiraceae bacterium]|jgi:putative membrane protein insertion efficiency factor|nr:membrane protein insertion efficiency factor YidD [Oscillospiraceae bacterium]